MSGGRRTVRGRQLMAGSVVLFAASLAVGCVVVFVLAACLVAAHADRLAGRLLGPASSDTPAGPRGAR